MGQGHDRFFFRLVGASQRPRRKFLMTFFRGVHLIFAENLRFFFLSDDFFLENICALCPRPQAGTSSEGRSLASDLFCVLGLCLEPCVLVSTSARPNNPKFDEVQLHPIPAVENSWLPDAHNSYAEDFTDAQPNAKIIEKQQSSFTRKIR